MDLLTAINWIPFLLAALALNLTPGSDMTFVAANASASVERGALAALGIGAGCAMWAFNAPLRRAIGEEQAPGGLSHG